MLKIFSYGIMTLAFITISSCGGDAAMELRMARQETALEVANLMGRYQSYHSAGLTIQNQFFQLS